MDDRESQVEDIYSQPSEYNKLLPLERRRATHLYRTYIKSIQTIPEMSIDRATFLGWYWGTAQFWGFGMFVPGALGAMFEFTHGWIHTVGLSMSYGLLTAFFVMSFVRSRQAKEMHPNYRKYALHRNFWE